MKAYESKYERERINLISKYIPCGEYESLDLGCGVGIFSKIMHDKGHKVLSIDSNEESINAAINNYKNFRQIEFAKNSVLDFINSTTKKFDFILALEIIEHLNNYEFFLKGITRLLRTNGKLILSTPNVFSSEGLIGTLWAKKAGKKYMAWDSTHEKIFNSFEFIGLIKAHNLRIEKIIGYYFNAADPLPLTNAYLRLPFSSISWFPLNMLGFNTIVIARRR
jgi:2-polyprenyl-6-hydroxyphenyl methylase/3-demethylubiquinone-9 3-methyltransferase